jgi:phosphohistidine phosphatase SixA
LLVRHAHAGSKRSWTGPDAERPLSERGVQEALGLLDRLEPFRITRLLSSPTLRCRQTLLPLASALDLDLEPVPALGVDTDLDDVVALLDAPQSQGAALCTHGEVISDLFGRLLAEGVVAFADEPRWEKGSTWVLDGDRHAGFKARYLAPQIGRLVAAQPGGTGLTG